MIWFNDLNDWLIQYVIFCIPNPANAFSTEPRATTIYTAPFSSKAIIRPKASLPAISPALTPLNLEVYSILS